MKYKTTLEVKVPDGTSFEDAEEFLQYAFGYSWKCDYNNPLTTDDTEVTGFKIEEL